MLDGLGMGGAGVGDGAGMGGAWGAQCTVGFPVAGILAGPGVFPAHPRPDPELGPHQLSTNAKYRIEAAMASVTAPHEGQSREDAFHVEEGLGGPPNRGRRAGWLGPSHSMRMGTR